MRHFGIFVRHLADVVKQACSLGFLRVEAQLCRHHGAEIGGLTGVLQQVLAVAAAVFHLADDANQFGMQAVYAQIDGGALTGLHHFLFHLLLHLGHHLFNTGGMDATVGNELMQCQSANLTADGIEGADDDGFRRVVHHKFHAGGCFQGADVTSFASDNTTFYFVVINVEHCDGILHCGFSGHTLYGLDDDAFGFLVGVDARFVHDFVDVGGSVGLGLVLKAFDELCLGFFA